MKRLHPLNAPLRLALVALAGAYGSPAVAAPPAAAAPAAAAPDLRPVTQDQFRKLVEVFRRMVDRLDKVEAQVKSGGGGGKGAGGEQAVDLGSIGSAPVSTAKGTHGGMGSGAMPSFKVYFDLNLINRPGTEDLSFDSFHNFLFFEILPTPEIQFSFDINSTPKFFELDYQLHPKFQLRAGKIWIPFDDMSPHNIFGGRVNVSRLAATNAPAFLPDLWTDLGIGFKASVLDTPKFQLDAYGYVVNGFRDGGKDLKNPETGLTGYPSFSDLPTSADNNRDKALGARIHALALGKIGVGVSYYTGRWNSDSQPEAMRLTIMGADGQIRFKNTEVRAGIISMAINLPTGLTANRGGLYGEVGQKFGPRSEWKVMARAGLTNYDDRILDTSSTVSVGDQQIIGGTVLWKPGLIQYSIEYSQDLKFANAKKNYSYTAARMVMAF